jgi:nucleoid-associated protein YgaU
MTADAKVGLLLGLVFIAIIAFVINGLPDVFQYDGEKTVVQTAVNTQTGGSLLIEPAVVDVARSLQEKRTTMRYVDPPVDTTVLEQYAGTAGGSVTTASTASTDDVAPQVEKTVPVAQKTIETIQTAQPETVIASKSQPAAAPGVSHVVEDGENLSEIAKKYYGDQEGNKLATIQMLYEANKSVLESPDAVRAGDHLVIPNIKSSAAAGIKKESPAATLLDKFKSVFTSVNEKSSAAVKSIQPVKTEKKQPVKGVTEYTVQSGDYLYKIAKKQLGDGNRYPEIIKLNSGLSDSDRLNVGMKLKIPKK